MIAARQRNLRWPVVVAGKGLPFSRLARAEVKANVIASHDRG
jgi:hypothetical protein